MTTRLMGQRNRTIHQNTECGEKFSGRGMEIQGLLIVFSYGHPWYKEATLTVDRKHTNAIVNPKEDSL